MLSKEKSTMKQPSGSKRAWRVDAERMRELISDAQLSEQLDLTLQCVREVVAAGIEELHPVLSGLLGSGPAFSVSSFVVHLQFDAHRHEMLRALGSGIVGQKCLPVVVSLVSEAWVVEISETDPEYTRILASGGLDVPAAQDARRKEILMLSLMTLDGRECGLTFYIERDASNHIVLGTIMSRYPEPGDDHQKKGQAQNALLASFYRGVHEAVARELERELQSSDDMQFGETLLGAMPEMLCGPGGPQFSGPLPASKRVM
jgi:hypothetical protein